jgi:SAM-dependent methyltransferase
LSETNGALEAEFDTVASWTEQVVAELGPEYAIPAGCRGSGSPAWLQWFADCIRPTPQTTFLDAGAGLGGPAAWLRERTGVVPVLAEPMEGACRGARHLFGLPTVAAWSQALPFADATFDAGWLLGVLDTTTDQAELLAELHRVLAPDALVGMLVLVQVADELPVAPEGNDFPTPESLDAGLAFHGFEVVERVRTGDLPSAEPEWTRRVAAVEDALEERFRGEDAWEQAREQGERMTLLLYGGAVQIWLICARRLAKSSSAAD